MIYKFIRCCTGNISKSNIDQDAPPAGDVRSIITMGEKSGIRPSSIMISKRTLGNTKSKAKQNRNMIADVIQDERRSSSSDDIFQTTITDGSKGEL